jgi:hypothetical protein
MYVCKVFGSITTHDIFIDIIANQITANMLLTEYRQWTL